MLGLHTALSTAQLLSSIRSVETDGSDRSVWSPSCPNSTDCSSSVLFFFALLGSSYMLMFSPLNPWFCPNTPISTSPSVIFTFLASLQTSHSSFSEVSVEVRHLWRFRGELWIHGILLNWLWCEEAHSRDYTERVTTDDFFPNVFQYYISRSGSIWFN